MPGAKTENQPIQRLLHFVWHYIAFRKKGEKMSSIFNAT